MIIHSHSQAQIFLNSNLQNRVRLINTEFNTQGSGHVKGLRTEAKFIQLFIVSTTSFERSMLMATVTNRTWNNGLGERGYKTNTQINNDTNGNGLIPITVTFDLIHASLGRQHDYLVRLAYSENYDGLQRKLITILRTTLTKYA